MYVLYACLYVSIFLTAQNMYVVFSRWMAWHRRSISWHPVALEVSLWFSTVSKPLLVDEYRGLYYSIHWGLWSSNRGIPTNQPVEWKNRGFSNTAQLDHADWGSGYKLCIAQSDLKETFICGSWWFQILQLI